ncbi:hypothetical protein [Amedibacillus sp. YH-ame10]
MDKQRFITVAKNTGIALLIFMVGFIGTILLIMKKTSDMTSFIVNIQAETKEVVKIFGVKIMEFCSVNKNGAFEITIIKNGMYEYFPFIVGVLLLLSAFLLTLIAKKTISKRS